MSEAHDILSIEEEFDEALSDPDLDETISGMTSAIDALLDPEFRARAIAIENASATIDLVLEAEFTEDQIQTEYQPIEEEFENEEDRKNTELFTAQAEKDKIAEADRRARNLMAKKIAGLLLGALVTDALLYYLVKMKNTKGDATDEFPQSSVDKAKSLLDQWRAQSDSVLWANIANFVDAYNASLQTQMTMMAYIKNWAPEAQITWGPGEKAGDIAGLVAAAAGRRASNIYQAVMGLTHGGQPLQRQVAADLCEHALAHILSKATGDSPQAT